MREDATTLEQEARKDELRAIVNDLNDSFENKKEYEDTSVYSKKTLESMRQIPFPVVVDLNNVLVNSELPLEPNPEASRFLRGLEELGATPVIVTTTAHRFRKRDIEFLKENGLWSEDMVFINLENYKQSPLDEHEEVIDEYLESDFAEKLLEDFDLENLPIRAREYLQQKKVNIDMDFATDNLRDSGGAYKRFAPIFNKEWKVPIVDDFEGATDGNFGMKGFKVMPFKSRERVRLEKQISDAPDDNRSDLEERLEEIPEFEKNERHSLLEILELIMEFKKSI